MSLICLLIAAVLFLLLSVEVIEPLEKGIRFDYLGLFFLALGLALAYLPPLSWPVVRRPSP